MVLSSAEKYFKVYKWSKLIKGCWMKDQFRDVLKYMWTQYTHAHIYVQKPLSQFRNLRTILYINKAVAINIFTIATQESSA